MTDETSVCATYFDLYAGFGGPVCCELPAGHVGAHVAPSRDADLVSMRAQHARWDAEDADQIDNAAVLPVALPHLVDDAMVHRAAAVIYEHCYGGTWTPETEHEPEGEWAISHAEAVLRAALGVPVGGGGIVTAHIRMVNDVERRLLAMGYPPMPGFAERLCGLGNPANPAGRVLALALALPAVRLEALLVAAENPRKPRARYRRKLRWGHHQSDECLERRGDVCRKQHVGRCDSCPVHHANLPVRSLRAALAVRREIDRAMWVRDDGDKATRR